MTAVGRADLDLESQPVLFTMEVPAGVSFFFAISTMRMVGYAESGSAVSYTSVLYANCYIPVRIGACLGQKFSHLGVVIAGPGPP